MWWEAQEELRFAQNQWTKIKNVEFSLVLKYPFNNIDESFWEVLEMQQFGTFSGTLRNWQFVCDGPVKVSTSLLGAYDY